MITGLGRLLMPLLKLPETAPEPPIGSHETLTVERAAPGYLNYLRLKWGVQLLFAIVGAAGILAATSQADSDVLLFFELLGIFVVIVGAILRLMVIRLDYELRWYVITDRSLLIREGIWNVREITLTFANVQNVKVSQGPLERIFGVSDVIVETAGGSTSPEQKGHQAALGHRGHLRGVADPHRIRDLMLDLLAKQKGTGLGDLDDSHVLETARPGAGPWSPAAVAALSEAATEARALRAAVAAR